MIMLLTAITLIVILLYGIYQINLQKHTTMKTANKQDQIKVINAPLSEDHKNKARAGLLRVAGQYPKHSRGRQRLLEIVADSCR